MALNNKQKEVYTMRRYDLTGSMKQSVSPFLMGDTEFTYLRNISYDEVGSLSKDGGYSQLGDDLAVSGSGDLLHLYTDSSGNNIQLAVTNGKLFKYSSDTWSEISHLEEWADGPGAESDTDSSSERSVYAEGSGTLFTDGQRSTAVNRGGYAYIVNELDGLRYTDGTVLTSIVHDNGGAEVKGKYIAVLDNELYVANLASPHTANHVVFTSGGGNTFYVPTEEGHNTYATTNNFFMANEAITGITAFQGTIVYFTESEMYMFNPQNNEVSIIARIGCVSHYSIQEINGVLYWANRDGIFRFNGKDLPELISIPITNWAVNSLWRLIHGAKWSTISAASFEGKYLLAIGDLTGTLPGDDIALTDVVIVYDTYRDVWYFLNNYPVGLWCRSVNSDGNLRLLFIEENNPVVHQKGYTYTAGGSAIEMVVRSKYFNFDMPENEKVLEDLLITCRPSGGDGYYMTVKLAVNGTNNYESFITSATGTKVELDAVSGTEFQLDRVTAKGVRARTVSYEFSNADSGINMILLGYTQQFRYLNNNMNLSI